MRAIARRLRRLEDQLGPPDGNPRPYFRIVLVRLDHKPGLAGAMCRRMLLPDGTVSENVVLGSSNASELTEEELDRWVESFPIEVADGRIRWRPLPPL